jgi:hypothetical protein
MAESWSIVSPKPHLTADFQGEYMAIKQQKLQEQFAADTRVV